MGEERGERTNILLFNNQRVLNREARWPLSLYIEASNLFIWAELGSSSILSEKCGECCSFVCARN
jgi:hypothetical protein